MSAATENFWRDFLDANADVSPDTPYQTWHFGNSAEMAAELAALVISGKKTATASLAEVNLAKPDEAPIPNGYSVVTDIFGKPLAVIQTVEIREIPFLDVDEQFAADEGEGDLSLAYWRKVHIDYFSREAKELGLEFSEGSIVCCERFKLLYSR